MTLYRFGLFIFAFLTIYGPQSAWAQNRHALLIGNKDYKQLDRLKNPVNDASDMGKLLENKGFAVTVLINANLRQMKEAISGLTDKLQQEDAVGLFYYAGHGVAVNDRNFLIPVDAVIHTEADIEFESVDAGRILANMQGARNKVNFLILDACRNNPYKKFRGVTRAGLAPMQTSTRGILILYAASAGEVAIDGDERNGLFTSHLMHAIDTPGLKVEDAFKKTANAVFKASHEKQLPWLSGVLVGDFYFTAGVSATVESHAANPQPRLTVRTSPEGAKVRLLEIAAPYQDGMRLKPGRYHVEVTHPGYRRHLEWLELGTFDTVYSVVLEALEDFQVPSVPQTGAVTAGYGDTSADLTDPYTGMEFVYIEPGCFMMGSMEGESNEQPVHRVCLTRGFKLGKYEVTQAQWQQVMGYNPSYFKNCGGDCPVENVSWDDAQAFVQKLNGLTGRQYRLPTEAEWEYACRGGGREETYCGGESADSLAWYRDNAGMQTHPVGRKRPNGLGLYDMSGNVDEWVQDGYADDYYRNSPVNDPQGPSNGSYRVIRGGGWYFDASFVRSTRRPGYGPGYREDFLGFRLVRAR